METTLYKVAFNDGRVFKVFCANKSQKKRFHASIQRTHKKPALVDAIENGIHDIAQWEKIVDKL